MTNQSHSSPRFSLLSFSRVAAVIVAIIAGLVLIGWIWDVETLKTGWPGLLTMKANSALAFLLASLSLWSLGAKAQPQSRFLAQTCAAVVAIIGLVTLNEYAFGWDLRIDQLLFQDLPSTVSVSPPGRMSHIGACNFLMMGLALALLHAGRAIIYAQLLALLAGLDALLVLIGYAFGIQSFYAGVFIYTQMGFHTAGAFLLLSVGLLLARPDQGLMAAITSTRAGGVMARRLLPVAIGFPPLLGWVRLLGHRTKLYDPEFGVALMVVLSIVLFAALLWWSARLLNQADHQQRQAEERVSASEEKFRALAHTAHEAIVSADSQGSIVYFNPGAEAAFGFQAAEVVGRPLTLLMPERFHDDHRRGLARFLSTGQGNVIGKTVELAGRRNDGSEFPMDLSLATWQTGEGSFFTGIIRDITERKRKEKEIAKLNADLNRRAAELEVVNKELQSFAYSVSHDLRAPLRAIDGFSRSLAEACADKLDGEAKSDLERVRAACQRMAQLIDDLLALSRVNRAEMRSSVVNLSALAEGISAELKKNQAGRRVEVVIAPDLTVKADANLLRVVLENLLGNAWKFTGKCPQATIELGVTQHNGQSAYFVRDNGAGFDMAYVGKLFGAFQRLHHASEFEGTGIGLATVQRIIHRHGGRVWAEGAVDKGATIYFTLPD